MNNLKGRLALILTLIFWASAFVGIRAGLAGYSPGGLALLRFIVASLVIAILFALLPPGNPMPWRIRLQIALIGIEAIGIYNFCLNFGELTVSAGIASFVIGLMPVMTIIISFFFLKEQLHPLAWVGIGISFLGLVLMVFGEPTAVAVNGGVIVIFIAALMGAVYSIFQKPFLTTYHPVAVTAWVIWGGTAFLLIFTRDLIQDLAQAGYAATLSVIYLGIFPGAVAYILWTYVLTHLTASKASVYLYTMPVLSTIMGLIFLGEYPTYFGLSGGLLSLLGAFLATRR